MSDPSAGRALDAEEQDFVGAGPLMAGVVRRLGAIIYDALVAIAILMIATLPFLPFIRDKVLVPSEVDVLAYAYRIWQLLVLAVFFGFFWTRRGQTVGMQAWRLRVEDEAGRLMRWRTAIMRFSYAALPWILAAAVLSFTDIHRWTWIGTLGMMLAAVGVLNCFSLWFTHDRRTWHDKLSHTRVIVLPKHK